MNFKKWNQVFQVLLLGWSLFVLWQYALRLVLPALLE